MRHVPSLLALALGACDTADLGGKPGDDTTVVNLDTALPGSGDTGVVPGANDTGTPAADDSAVAGDDTVPPLPTDEDTFVPASTLDTAAPQGGPLDGDLYLLHEGVYDPYMPPYLRFRGLIVTGARRGTATNFFAAQDPDPTVTTHGGLWVQVGSDDPPEIGDEIDIVGLYDEWPNISQGQLNPYHQTVATLQVLASDPSASWSVISTDNDLPEPEFVPLAVVDGGNCLSSGNCDRHGLEIYEGMRITVAPMGSLAWSRTSGIYEWLTYDGEDVAVSSWCFDTTYPWSAGATVDRVTGIVFFLGVTYSVAPTSDLDVTGFARP